MKKSLLLFCLTAATLLGAARWTPLCAKPLTQDLLVVFWNLENCFDYRADNGGEEWSAQGSRRWTSRRFYTKCNAIGKTLLWVGEQWGQVPDIVALAEVENEDVVRRICQSPVLRKWGYTYVHRDSPDKRGIDVALLYRKERFPGPPRVKIIRIQEFRTRDILSCRFALCTEQDKTSSVLQRKGTDTLTNGADTLTILVNHHPSKLGGEKRSRPKRECVMDYLREECQALGQKIIACGDFNDTPDGAAFRLLEGVLVHLPPRATYKEIGTIKYDGKWELIDLFWLTPDLIPRCECEVIYAPFLLCEDRGHAGKKPLRTYSGPRYLGGISDHLPVVLRYKAESQPPRPRESQNAYK